MEEQNIKLAELRILKEVKNEMKDALITDCDTFQALQQLQLEQSKNQQLLVEFNFLRQNYDILVQKQKTQDNLINRLTDLLHCPAEQIFELVCGLKLDQEQSKSLIFELEKTTDLQRSKMGQSQTDDMSRSVRDLLSKYHEDSAGSLGNIFELRLNSEKIIRDANEVLE